MPRLSIRLERFEVIAVLIAASLLAGAAAYVSMRLDGLAIEDACWRSWLAQGDRPFPESCIAGINAWHDLNDVFVRGGLATMNFLPLAFGLVLGVPVVGRELEGRTAALAWSLSPSRTRWYAGRMLPILLVLVAASVVSALAATALEGAREPWSGGQLSLWDAELSGPPPVARAVAAFGLAVLLGAVLGRTLPALIVSGALVVAAVAIAAGAQGVWLDTQKSVVADADSGPGPDFSGAIVDVAWQAPDGRLLTDEEALGLVPAGETASWLWTTAGMRQVQLGVSDDRVADWQWLEAGVALAAGAGFLIATIPIVDRRTPLP